MKRRIINIAAGLMLACLFTMQATAQKPAAGKAERLAKIAFSLMSSAPDSALKLAQAGLAAALAEHNNAGYASCLNASAMALYRRGSYDSAARIFRMAIAAFESQRNQRDAARALINLSAMYTDQALYEQAMQAVVKARRYAESAGDESLKAYAEKMIGLLYRQQGCYTQAIPYLRAAMRGFERSGDTMYVADALSSLGNTYILTGAMDSAFQYFYRSLRIHTRLSNINGMAYVNENLGDACSALADGRPGNWNDSALRYYQTAYALFGQLGSHQSIAYEKMLIGNVLEIKGNPEQAREYFRQALAAFDSGRNYSYASQTLARLRMLEERAGRYRAAFGYASKELRYNDTLASGNRREVMAGMMAKYEVDKRDRTIALLHAQQQLAQQELHHRRSMEAAYLVMGLIAIGLVLLLLNHYRVRQQLKEVKMRNQLASDLHDDVGSSLSSILLLSKMALSGSGDQQEILATIRRNAGEVIERMSDIIWTTNPRFDRSANLSARMENYLQQLRQGSMLRIQSDIAEDAAAASFPMELRKNVFLIFKEAVNNALKHADATALEVFFGLEDGRLQLRVCDNGKGFTPDDDGSGLGLSTMRQRAAALKATLRISPSAGGGTCVSLILPSKRYRKADLQKTAS